MSTRDKERGKKSNKEATGKRKRAGSRKPSKSVLVEKMLQRFEKKLDAEEVNMNIGDFIRLMQLRKEMEAEDPKEIKATWVEPTEKESATDT
jgi:hypothetical protein